MHMMHYRCICDSHKLRLYFMQYARSFTSKYKKTMFVFDHSLGTVTLISIPFTSYNALLSLVQYSLSLKLGVHSNFAEFLEIEKKHTNMGFLMLMLKDHTSGGGHF